MNKIIYSLTLFLFIYYSACCQPLPTAYYPFNGNANDESGNGINGTLFGNPTLTSDRFGNTNSAYMFDGVDDYINLGSSMTLKPSNSVTLALWAYSDNWTSFTSWAALAGNTASGGYELIIHGSSGTIEAECKRNGTYAIVDYPLSSMSNGWHHLAFTFDGRYTILYVDGIAVDTDDAGTVYPIQYGYPGNSTIIGDEAGTGNTPEGDSYTGKIDEVYFYNVALSAQEILALFNSTEINEKQNVLNNSYVYPSPSKGTIYVLVPNQNETYNIVLTDITGKIKLKTELFTTDNKLYFVKPSNISQGLYLLQIVHNNGFSMSYKVVFE